MLPVFIVSQGQSIEKNGLAAPPLFPGPYWLLTNLAGRGKRRSPGRFDSGPDDV